MWHLILDLEIAIADPSGAPRGEPPMSPLTRPANMYNKPAKESPTDNIFRFTATLVIFLSF